jgi:hypothetical protein
MEQCNRVRTEFLGIEDGFGDPEDAGRREQRREKAGEGRRLAEREVY